jgi:hypothetical protein
LRINIHDLAARFIKLYTAGRKEEIPAVSPNDPGSSFVRPAGIKEVDLELVAYLKYLEEENTNGKS